MFEMRLELRIRCALCGQLHVDGYRDEVAVHEKLFGAKRFAICLRCGQTVSPAEQTDEYKLEWARLERVWRVKSA